MLSKKKISRIQEILKRLSKGEEVSFAERLYIREQADEDQKVMAWVKKASKLQIGYDSDDLIDEFLTELELGSSDTDCLSKPDPEDLGNWFKGAPSWVARS